MNETKDNSNPKQIKIYQPNRKATSSFSIWKEMFAELSQSKELIMRLSIRDFSAGYKQSVFGILWAFIMHLFTVGKFVLLRRFQYGREKNILPGICPSRCNNMAVGSNGVTACTDSLEGVGNHIFKINLDKK